MSDVSGKEKRWKREAVKTVYIANRKKRKMERFTSVMFVEW